jgi:hypothetical protein
MEAALYQSEELDEERAGEATRVEVGNERTRGVVECGGITSERSIPEVLL